MDFVTSTDGTRIAYERSGTGRPIVFATGAFNDHTTCAPVAEQLADDFTVLTYDRRARGQSGDTRPYAIDREVEDLAALIGTVGDGAAVFGYSSGALLAIHAAVAKARLDPELPVYVTATVSRWWTARRACPTWRPTLPSWGSIF